MSENVHLRNASLFLFKQKKAAESHLLLVEMENLKTVCEMLFQMDDWKSFLYLIVVVDKKWIYLEAPKRTKSLLSSDEAGPWTPKSNWSQDSALYLVGPEPRGVLRTVET